MKFIRVIGLFAGLSLFVSVVANQTDENKKPIVVLRQIKNKTPFPLTITDQFDGHKSLSIEAGESLVLNAEIKGFKNGYIPLKLDDKVKWLPNNFQFLIHKVRGQQEMMVDIVQRAYFSMLIESKTLHIFRVSEDKRCETWLGIFTCCDCKESSQHKTLLLNSSEDSLVEVDLVLSIENKNIEEKVFNLHGECVLHNNK